MKYVFRRVFTVANGLFAALLLIQILPSKEYRVADQPIYTIGLAVLVELLLLLATFLIKKVSLRHVLTDVSAFVYAFLIFWVLATIKLGLVGSAKQAVFPPPGAVFARFAADFSQTLVNIRDSLGLIAQGYLIAVAIAIPLGLFLG
jgi:NitT/TauT family transport system permease protein